MGASVAHRRGRSRGYAVCIASRREDRVTEHVRQALRAGASRAEALEVIGMAILMSGQRAIRAWRQRRLTGPSYRAFIERFARAMRSCAVCRAGARSRRSRPTMCRSASRS